MIYAALILALIYLTFVHYAAVMNLQRVRDAGRLTRVQFVFAYTALGIGLVLDVLLNLVVCLVMLTIPRDWLVTGTLIRYKRKGPGASRLARWRCAVAVWVCGQLLDSLDPHPSGCHCRAD